MPSTCKWAVANKLETSSASESQLHVLRVAMRIWEWGFISGRRDEK